MVWDGLVFSEHDLSQEVDPRWLNKGAAGRRGVGLKKDGGGRVGGRRFIGPSFHTFWEVSFYSVKC